MRDAFYRCLILNEYLYNDKNIIRNDNNLLLNDKMCVKIKLTINK